MFDRRLISQALDGLEWWLFGASLSRVIHQPLLASMIHQHGRFRCFWRERDRVVSRTWILAPGRLPLPSTAMRLETKQLAWKLEGLTLLRHFHKCPEVLFTAL